MLYTTYFQSSEMIKSKKQAYMKDLYLNIYRYKNHGSRVDN